MFYDHLKYFIAFGILMAIFVFSGNFIYIFLFWYFLPRKSGNPDVDPCMIVDILPPKILKKALDYMNARQRVSKLSAEMNKIK
jgi:hypothetical protein